jgi:gamma-glutamyl hercynylcysteine S-oxide synthase
MKYLANCFYALMLFLSPGISLGQVETLLFDDPVSFSVKGITLSGKKVVTLPYGQPLFTLLVDSNFYSSYCAKSTFSKSGIQSTVADSIAVFCRQEKKFRPGIKYIVRFTNNGKSNHTLQNLVPLGEGADKVYITASGSKEWPQYLCRTKLFRQGYAPVGVVMPDNAWHAGFSDFFLNDTLSIAALARRSERDKERSEIDRWSVTLKPGGWIEYNIYFDIHRDGWHEGLKMMFQDRWLYDLAAFDESLYKRSDLGWMKNKYLILLQFAWDKKYFDYNQQKFTFYRDFFAYDSLTGGFDIYALWPTWPRLGLDQRNQWDMYRDLPGGVGELRKQVEFIHKKGRKYFISYNPWDEGTRREDQMKGMETLLRATDADGVVLDTRGASSLELQATADKVKPGIIMYSEGMAVPKDMPGIVSGRVHDALVMPPPLNLNKLIKPDFAIFRVLQLADDRLHREVAIAFFNGYGVEINTMRPGRPVWMEEEFEYLGRTTRLLRENNSVFHNHDYIPLIETLCDSIYVNQWKSGQKTIFTIFSLKPQGWFAPLFFTGEIGNRHLVDLWNHEEIMPVMEKGNTLATVKIEGFNSEWLDTRREGNVGCVALLPELLHIKTTADTIYFRADAGKTIVITGKNPDYRSKRYTFSAMGNEIPYWDYFPETVEKIVVQLFDDDELLDERIFFPKHDIPRCISRVEKTEIPKVPLTGMSLIPAGPFRFYTTRAPGTLDPFIPFPDHSDTVTTQMQKFYMDEYPVTNQQYRFFLKKSGYVPRDTTNFLKHWQNNAPAEGEADHPVVYVNLDDARAYAKWIGRRLPTEKEWQYAAQGNDMRKYPWGNSMDSTRCNHNSNKPATVYQHPEGTSPFGVKDMIGNVWQMTNDVYFNGAYYYNIIRGGSYYHPTSSIWYIAGGALPADHPEMLLLISPALDRNATVGFRCVKDAE